MSVRDDEALHTLEAHLSRVRWLHKLRRGQRLTEDEPSVRVPYDLFCVEDWNHFAGLLSASFLAAPTTPELNAAFNALFGEGDTLTERRQTYAQMAGVSERTLMRLEDRGLEQVEHQMWWLASPRRSTEVMRAALILLALARRSAPEGSVDVELMDQALPTLYEAVGYNPLSPRTT